MGLTLLISVRLKLRGWNLLTHDMSTIDMRASPACSWVTDTALFEGGFTCYEQPWPDVHRTAENQGQEMQCIYVQYT